MGPILQVPTLDEWLANMYDLLYMTAHWLLESWFGPTVLVLFVMLYTVPLFAKLGGPDPLLDDQPWED